VTAALRLDHVSVDYGAFRAVDDVSIVVPSGTVVALLGPNGAGKTTTLKAISGLLRPRAGTIHLNGERIDGMAPERIARKGVCHVPEGRGVFGQLTVRENLAVAARKDATTGWLERALDAFPDLAPRLEQRAATLSGGQQQMLALARAFVTKAPLLLLDELSLGLAPALVDRLYEAIARLRDEGRTIVLVEQYVGRALDLAEIVTILARGRVAFAGEPAELRASGDILASYLGAMAAG
jgi:branched-chain amino acid transport system ATP-binding protein